MTDKITAPHVYQAITNVMAAMSKEGIGKGRRNQQQGYNFRGIDDVYNTLCGVLAENRLVILPSVKDMQREERQTQKGGMLNYTILTVDFKLVSSLDGSADTIRMIGEAMDSADKSSNKSQSAALKYACLQVFMIPTEGDNDADATTHEVVAKPANKPRQTTKDIGGITDSQIDQIKALMGQQTKHSTASIITAYQSNGWTGKDFCDFSERDGAAIIKRLNATIDEERIAANPQRDDELNDEVGF